MNIVVISIILLLLSGLDAFAQSAQCSDSIKRLSKMNIAEISLVNDAGKVLKLKSYIADDNSKRASGYQFICAGLINKTYILFVYPQPVSGKFHMQNVKAPLDIGFFDDTGQLISTMRMETYADDISALNPRLYHPGQAFQYALESRGGFFNAQGLSAGKARILVPYFVP